MLKQQHTTTFEFDLELEMLVNACKRSIICSRTRTMLKQQHTTTRM